MDDCRTAIQLDTNSAAAYNNLAWMMAVAPDEKFRDGTKAVEYASRACDLTGWKEPYCLGTLAAAYAESGVYEKAVDWQTKSLEIGIALVDVDAAKLRLGLYKRREPYHVSQ
jgi:hypothetical protein